MTSRFVSTGAKHKGALPPPSSPPPLRACTLTKARQTLLRELEGADPEYVNELSTQDGNAALHYVAKLLDNPTDKGVLQALVAKGVSIELS